MVQIPDVLVGSRIEAVSLRTLPSTEHVATQEAVRPFASLPTEDNIPVEAIAAAQYSTTTPVTADGSIHCNCYSLSPLPGSPETSELDQVAVPQDNGSPLQVSYPPAVISSHRYSSVQRDNRRLKTLLRTSP